MNGSFAWRLKGKGGTREVGVRQWVISFAWRLRRICYLNIQASNSLARNKHEKCSFRDNARKFEVKQVQGMEGEMSGEGETKGALPLMVPLPRH